MERFVSLSDASTYPPIVPPVAVMLLVDIVPVTLALVAVSTPSFVTENTAPVPALLVAPAKNANPLSAAVSMMPAYFVAPRFVIRSEPIAQPPIWPADAEIVPVNEPLVAVTAPVMVALVAVRAPSFVTLNAAVAPVLVVPPAKNATPVEVLEPWTPAMYGLDARAL